MRVLTLQSFDAQPALQDDVPEPRPSDDDVLVRVHVIAPALPEDEDFLRGLGGDELVDRNADVTAAHPAGVDAILDVVSQTPDVSLLKEGGRLASTLGAADEGRGRFDIMAEPTPANLKRLANLHETGALRVLIQRSYEFEQAGDALQALPSTHTQGKLGLAIAQTRG